MEEASLAHLILQSLKYPQIYLPSGAGSCPLSGRDPRLTGGQAFLNEHDETRPPALPQPGGIISPSLSCPIRILRTSSSCALKLHGHLGAEGQSKVGINPWALSGTRFQGSCLQLSGDMVPSPKKGGWSQPSELPFH